MPIGIAGVLAIYGVIIAVLLCGKLQDHKDSTDTAVAMMTVHQGHAHLAAGLAVGLSCLASGWALSSFSHFLLWSGDDERHGGGRFEKKMKQVAPEREALLLDANESQATVVRKKMPNRATALIRWCCGVGNVCYNK